MDTLIINEDHLKEEDIHKEVNKVRAVLLSNGKMLMSRYYGILLFPGGKIDEGETPKDALIRELREETGIVYDINDFSHLLTIKYYQKNFPTIEGKILNRIMTTSYYVGDLKGIDLSNTKKTEREKEGNFQLELMNVDDVLSFTKEPSENPRKPFFDRELKEVVKVLSIK